MTIKDLMQLAGKQGKVIVVNELGGVQGVFLSFDSYQKLVGVPEAKIEPKHDAEKINREILDAQLSEESIMSATEDQTLAPAQPPIEKLDALLSKRAEQLFKSIPYNYNGHTSRDLRAEVIDPNYDFNEPESSEDEVIRPSFDDI